MAPPLEISSVNVMMMCLFALEKLWVFSVHTGRHVLHTQASRVLFCRWFPKFLSSIKSQISRLLLCQVGCFGIAVYTAAFLWSLFSFSSEFHKLLIFLVSLKAQCLNHVKIFKPDSIQDYINPSCCSCCCCCCCCYPFVSTTYVFCMSFWMWE